MLGIQFLKKMRIKILAIVTLLLSTSIANSQLRYGIRIGAGLSAIKSNPDHIGLLGNFKPKASYSANLFTEYTFNEDIIFESGIGYSRMGFKYGLAPNVGNLKFNASKKQENVKLDYIFIPFIAKYKFSDFRVGGGAQLGYLANIQGWPAFKKIDFGVTIVGEYSLSTDLSFSARYLFGITNLNGSSSIQTKNKDLTFNLGYRF